MKATRFAPALALALTLGTSLSLSAADAPSLAPPHAPLIDGLPVPVTAHPDQLSLLDSRIPALATNKRLVFDMWRTVMLAGQTDAIARYFSPGYREHGQRRRNGRDALEALIAGTVPYTAEVPALIPDVVTLVAEGDHVILAQVSHYPEPDGSGDTYTSTRFDMYLIENGLISAHWDSEQLTAGLGVPATADGGPLPVVGIQGLDQLALIASDDPQLFMNKRLAFDLWRHLPEAGREELAELYLDPIYIQHNPNAATGREGVKVYFSQRPDSPIDSFLEDPIVALVAEGDLVVQVLQEERPHPDTGETYYVPWFDMFRIRDGLVIEHWDTASKGELPAVMQ